MAFLTCVGCGFEASNPAATSDELRDQTELASAIDGTGEFRWLIHEPLAKYSNVLGAATDANGFSYVFRTTYVNENEEAGEISKYASDGSQVLSRRFPLNGFSNPMKMAVSSSGEIYFTAFNRCVSIPCYPANFGGGPVVGSVLVKFKTDGTFAWQRSVELNSLDVHTDGTVLLLTVDAHLLVLTPDNQVLMDKLVPGVTAAAFDPSGAMVLGFSAGNSGGLRKLDPAGNEVWTTLFASGHPSICSMSIVAVDVTALGTVVAVANYAGGHSWGPIALPIVDNGPPPYENSANRRGVLFAAESYGAPRFAVPMEGDFYSYAPQFALDRAWRAYVVDGAGTAMLTKYNLEGTKLWTRPFEPWANGLAVTADHGVIAWGSHWQTHDFGSGQLDAGSFVVKYGP